MMPSAVILTANGFPSVEKCTSLSVSKNIFCIPLNRGCLFKSQIVQLSEKMISSIVRTLSLFNCKTGAACPKVRTLSLFNCQTRLAISNIYISIIVYIIVA